MTVSGRTVTAAREAETILCTVSEAINSSAPSNRCPGTRFVSIAAHADGGGTGFENQKERTDAAATAPQISGRPKKTSPGATIAAARPSQAVPGKRTPADVMGDAQPIRPNGGRTPTANAIGILHAAAVRFRVHAKVRGSASTTAATIQAMHPAITVVAANEA
jgi:hypothetical protein